MDGQLAAHCLDSERFLLASLSDVDTAFSSAPCVDKSLAAEQDKGDMFSFLQRDPSKFHEYSGLDAMGTLSSCLGLKEALMRDPISANYYVKFLHPVTIELLFHMEKTGIQIDVDSLPEVSNHLDSSLEDYRSEFISLCPSQVVEKYEPKPEEKKKKRLELSRHVILHDTFFKYTDPKSNEEVDIGLGIEPPLVSPKTGRPVFDKNVRQELKGQVKSQTAFDLLTIFDNWSETNTLTTRYIPGIRNYLGPDNRIHPSYGIPNTNSGRTGARNPSIQNFPKRGKLSPHIRRLICARPGKKLIEVDYNVSELRWIAHVANERTLKDLLQKGEDPHIYVAKRVVAGDEARQWEELSATEKKELRQKSKPVNFGFSYRMSWFGFKKYAKLILAFLFPTSNHEISVSAILNCFLTFRFGTIDQKRISESIKESGQFLGGGEAYQM
jgi:DNA polymerase I-like protein with 3'-5' exonuclease and polymerase domains